MRNLRASITLAAFLASSISSISHAESVYGLEIGGVISLPECAPMKLYGSPTRYEPSTRAACAQLQTPGAPRSSLNPVTAILFPWADKPAHSKGNLVGVIEIDGALQVMLVSTPGQYMQDQILEDLKAKFGQPSAARTVTFQNRVGAQFQGIQAAWDKGDALQVEFLGLAGSLDEGQIVFGTKAGLAERKRRMDEAMKKFGGRTL